jgi:hypothetical protein
MKESEHKNTRIRLKVNNNNNNNPLEFSCFDINAVFDKLKVL